MDVKRISVSLKVDSSDELYWALIQPLQQNRQLATFIVSLLQAYKDDSDIHDLVDTFVNEHSSVAKMQAHLNNLIDLQAKATRYAEDVSSSLGGMSNDSIENVFDSGNDDTVSTENGMNTSKSSANEGYTNPNGLSTKGISSSDLELYNSLLNRLISVEDSIKAIQYKMGDKEQAEIGVQNVEKSVESVENLPKSDESSTKAVESAPKADPYLKSMIGDILGGF